MLNLESERILAVIPWLGKLQPDNKAQFKDDLRLLLATMDLTEDELLKILEFMDDWKATAQVDGDPYISSLLRRKRRIKDCQPE